MQTILNDSPFRGLYFADINNTRCFLAMRFFLQFTQVITEEHIS